MKKIQSLAKLLLDPSADIAEQDDAADYLGNYNDDKALSALISASKGDIVTDYSVLQTCGESIARIWVLRDQFEMQDYVKLCMQARLGALDYIEGMKPEWFEKYNLRIDYQ